MKNFLTQYRRHSLIFLACCGMVAASVGLCTNAYGVFYTDIANALGVGRAAVTLHATLCGILTGVLSPFVVHLTDKVSIKKIVCGGAALSSLSFFLMAGVQRVWMLNLCGILRGIGNSCFFMPIITLVLGNWFKKDIGSITGVVMAFSGVLGAVLSPLLTGIITASGFRAASVFCGIFIAVCTLPLCLTALLLHPADVGLLPYGEGTQSEGILRQIRKVNPFRYNAPVFFFLVGMTFLCVFTTGLTSQLSGMAESIGAGSQVGAAMISAVMVGNILSKFLSGILADKIGTYKAFGMMFLVAIAGCVLMQLVTGTGLLLLAAFLFGTIYAVSAVGLPSIVRHVYGNRQYGHAFSILSMVSVIAPSVAMVLIGYLYDLTGGYSLSIQICTAFGILALILWCLAAKAAEKNRTMEDDLA